INWKAHRLTRLESELRKLQVNQDAAEAKRLEIEFSDLMDYASCSGRECRIYLRADWYVLWYLQGHGEKLDYLISELAELLARPTLSQLGIRMWFAKVIITIADGKVADYRLSVLLEAPHHYWMMASWAMYDKISSDDLGFYNRFREKDTYFVHWTHLHVGM